MFDWLNSWLNDWLYNQENEETKAIDKAIVELGYEWIDWENDPVPSDPATVRWLRAFGDRGQRDENLYALTDRTVPKKRFTIHNSLSMWRLDLWFGTLAHGFPPDLRDGDGVSFFKNDVKYHSSIHVMIQDDPTEKFSLDYYDNSFKTFPSRYDDFYFQELDQLLHEIEKVKEFVLKFQIPK